MSEFKLPDYPETRYMKIELHVSYNKYGVRVESVDCGRVYAMVSEFGDPNKKFRLVDDKTRILEGAKQCFVPVITSLLNDRLDNFHTDSFDPGI